MLVDYVGQFVSREYIAHTSPSSILVEYREGPCLGSESYIPSMEHLQPVSHRWCHRGPGHWSMGLHLQIEEYLLATYRELYLFLLPSLGLQRSDNVQSRNLPLTERGSMTWGPDHQQIVLEVEAVDRASYHRFHHRELLSVMSKREPIQWTVLTI